MSVGMRLLLKRDLTRDRSLSIAIIVLSFLLVTISAIGIGATLTNQREYDDRYTKSQAPDGIVLYSPGTYSDSYSTSLGNHPDVDRIDVADGIEGVVNSSSTQIEVPLLVTSSDDSEISVSEGTYPVADHEIALPEIVISALSIDIGDEVEFSIAGVTSTFTLVGTIDDLVFSSPIMSTKRALVTQEAFSHLENDGGSELVSTLVTFDVSSSGSQNEEGLKAKKIIEETSIAYSSTFAYDSSFVRRAYMMVPTIILVLLSLVSLVIAFVIALVLNEMARGLVRREWKNSGILKVLGWNGRTVRRRLVLKLMVLACFGSIVGAACAAVLIPELAKIYLASNGLHMTGTSVQWPSVVLMLLTTMYIGIVAAASTRSVSKVRPRDSIAANVTKYQPKRTPGFPRRLALTNLFTALAVHDVRRQFRRYFTLASSTALLMFLTLSLTSLWMNFSTARQVSQALGLNTYDIVATRTAESMAETEEQVIAALKDAVSKHGEVEFISSMDQVTVQTPAGNVVATVSQKVPGTAKLSAGHVPVGDRQIMIASGLARTTGLTEGDSISLEVNDSQQQYEISGVYETVNQTGLTLWMPEPAYRSLNSEYVPSTYVVDLSSPPNDDTVAALTTSINDRGAMFAASGRISTDSLISTVQLVMLTLVVTFVVTTVLVATTVALLISYTAVTEESRDLRLYETLGVFRSSLARMYSLRTAMVTAAGAVGGALLSLLGNELLIGSLLNRAGLHDLDLSVPAWAPAIGCVFIALTTYIVSGVAVRTMPPISRQAVVQE